MSEWYTIYSFVTNSTHPTEDLTAFFNVTGVAVGNRKNLSWRLVEVGASGSYANLKWSGDMDSSENTMLVRSGDCTFTSGYTYDGYLKLQVLCDPAPAPKPDDTPPPCDCSCDCRDGNSPKPIRYSNGEIQMTVDDLAGSGFGFAWGHTRVYNNRLSANFNFDNGYNWMVRQWANLVKINSDLSEIKVAISPRETYNFVLTSGVYVARHGALQTLTHDTTNNLFYFTDTDGRQWTFYNFSHSSGLYGKLSKFTSPGGETITLTYGELFFLTNARRTYSGVTESFDYTFTDSNGDNTGVLQSVTLRRQASGSTTWTDVRRVRYEYYASGDSHGSSDDLKLAAVQIPNGSGGWTDDRVHYYRYWNAANSSTNAGFVHGLKYVFGPEAYKRLTVAVTNPSTATDAQAAPYADYYFEYDSSQRVIKEITDAGTQTYTFAFTTNSNASYTNGYNNWKTKTVETKPDGSTNTVYTNYIGQVLISDLQDAADNSWIEHRRYDANGRLVLHATPAAIDDYDDSHYDFSASGAVTLHASAGLIELTEYGDGTTDHPAGYVRYKKIKQGESGTAITLSETVYTSQTANSVTVYVPSEQHKYRNEDATGDIVVSFAYTWHTGTTQIKTRTTTLPVISTSENGTGTAATQVEVFDINGNLTWSKDQRGLITRHVYDTATGAKTRTIQDVNLSQTGGAPSGWTTPTGGGLHQVSDFTVDSLGRTTRTLGPAHAAVIDGTSQNVRTASWTVYDDTHHAVLSASGYVTSTTGSPVLVNPVSITISDANDHVTDEIAAVWSGTVAEFLAADLNDFPQSTWRRWKHHIYDDAGQLTATREYFDIPTNGSGTSGANYNEATFDYDSLGRQNKKKTPGGTITRTVFNCRGQEVKTDVGTNDDNAYDSDPTGVCECCGKPTEENNMVCVVENVFDSGTCCGSGNLTQSTKHVDATSANDRIVNYTYDWRNRLRTTSASDGSIVHITANTTIDNLGRVTQTDGYHTAVADANRVSRVKTYYDALNRVYKTETFSVDAATGAVGNCLTSYFWYDAAGRKIKELPAGSQAFSDKRQGVLNGSTIAYNDLGVGDTTGDTLFEQDYVISDTAGNALFTISYSRNHDASATGSASAGDLTSSNSRVTYSAAWYDGVGRVIATADYGTAGGTAMTIADRPTVPPTSSDTVPVSLTEYDNIGQAYKTTDPMGRVIIKTFDALGRVLSTTQNYVVAGTAVDENITTAQTYNADGQVLTVTDPLSHTTTNGYDGLGRKTSVTDANAHTTYFGFNRLHETTSLTDPDENTTTWTYNGLGQKLTETNTLGKVRSFSYNTISKLAAETDRNGRVIQYNYDGFGRQTSEVWRNGAATVRTLLFNYDSTGNRLAAASDPAASYSYTYDSLDRVVSTTHTIDGLTPVATLAQSLDGSGRRVSQSATLDSTADFQNSYSYDRFGRLSSLAQTGATGGNVVAEKRVDFAYNRLGQFGTVTRYANAAATKTVATSSHAYDTLNRLASLNHAKGSTSLASHAWTFDAASRMTQYVNSVDGTVNYTNDPTSQLTGADYASESRTDETYVYDANGNRTNNGCVIAANNRLVSDGTYTYGYDDEGNCTTRIDIITGATTRSTWDYRNRLVQIAEYPSATSSTATKTVQNTYDVFNRWVKRVEDSDGDGAIDTTDVFVHDENQIVLQFATGQGDSSFIKNSHRYLWGPSVDQLLVDEALTYTGSLFPSSLYPLVANSPRWPLCDHLNTVRDLASYDSASDATSILNHRVYNSYGQLISETNSSFSCLFGFTGRPFDIGTGLQNNLNRWYDPVTERWMSEDPIGFRGGMNLYEYCYDSPLVRTDPGGNDPWKVKQPNETWIISDYFAWYYYGQGQDVSLDRVGLLQPWWKDIKPQVLTQLKTRLVPKLESKLSCESEKTNVTIDVGPVVLNVSSGGGGNDELTVMGNSNVNVRGSCKVEIDCKRCCAGGLVMRAASAKCDLDFSVRDKFQNPLDKGGMFAKNDWVGAKPYDLFASWSYDYEWSETYNTPCPEDGGLPPQK